MVSRWAVTTMSDIDRYLTDEVVEKAAKTRWDYDCAESGDTTEWDMRYPSFREFDTDAMRAALESALPDIIRQAKAEALRKAAEEFWARLPDGTGNGRAYNSHRVADMLRARADQIAGDDS